MKKSHILILVVIAVAVGVIISTTGDASSYVNFSQAHELASSGNDKSVHVVGQLKKRPDGEVTGLEKSADNLSFTFVMVDETGTEETVYHNEPMPSDFLRSEKVVIIGHFQGNTFLAEKILLKCPSKYEENKIRKV
jgi:cytochrome c-type biogenesis protein CcmE